MRIIKRATKQKQVNPLKWKMRMTCKPREVALRDDEKACGTVFEVKAQNLFVAYWLSYGQNRRYYPGVRCPHCGKLLTAGAVPDSVWNYVRHHPKNKKRIYDGYWDHEESDNHEL